MPSLLTRCAPDFLQADFSSSHQQHPNPGGLMHVTHSIDRPCWHDAGGTSRVRPLYAVGGLPEVQQRPRRECSRVLNGAAKAYASRSRCYDREHHCGLGIARSIAPPLA